MEPEGSLLCSQEPATGTYPEQDVSSPHPHNYFKIRSNIILPSTSRSSEWSTPFRFYDQNFVCVSYPHPSYMSGRPMLLDLINIIILGEAF